MYTKDLPELLAPAGDFECLKAAVAAGADAVYFGCSKYNARAFAGNFDDDLQQAFNLCRLYGVKVYITFNTLAYDREFNEVFDYASDVCNKYKPDAVIVQDIGLAKCLNSRCGVPIVASTQMAQHNAGGAEFLRSIGVFRIVAAREMTLNDVVEMARQSKMETELFIHGAICVCQSGGCLMSSMIGKRSGNRGECAQPCRLPYNGGYPLSLKDMCLANHITEIIASGISSLKIEGRMKEPSYVYAVTSVYRKLLDERRNASEDEIKFLEAVFSRSGFTDAYFTGKLSSKMFGIRTQNDKIKTSQQHIEIVERKLPIGISALLDKEHSQMIAKYLQYSASVSGDKPTEALNKPLTEEDVEKRISKTGTSCFEVVNSEVKISGNLFMPVSSVNDLRRKCISALEENIIKANTPKYSADVEYNIPEIKRCQHSSKICVRLLGASVPNASAFEEIEGIEFFEIPLWRIDKVKEYCEAFPKKVRIIMPRCIYPEDEENIELLVSKAINFGAIGAVCSGFAQKKYVQNLPMIADYVSNAVNKYSINLYKNFGFSSVCLSPEMPAGAMRAAKGILPLSVVAYGKIALMHTRCCIIENTSKKACKRIANGICQSELADRTGAKFCVIREYGHRNMVHNSVPMWLFDKDLSFADEIILSFTDENEKRIKQIIRYAKENAKPDENITRGYY